MGINLIEFQKNGLKGNNMNEHHVYNFLTDDGHEAVDINEYTIVFGDTLSIEHNGEEHHIFKDSISNLELLYVSKTDIFDTDSAIAFMVGLMARNNITSFHSEIVSYDIVRFKTMINGKEDAFMVSILPKALRLILVLENNLDSYITDDHDKIMMKDVEGEPKSLFNLRYLFKVINQLPAYAIRVGDAITIAANLHDTQLQIISSEDDHILVHLLNINDVVFLIGDDVVYIRTRDPLKLHTDMYYEVIRKDIIDDELVLYTSESTVKINLGAYENLTPPILQTALAHVK